MRMAGTRLLAQINFVICILIIFFYSMKLLKLPYYYCYYFTSGSHLQSYLLSSQGHQLPHETTNYTNIEYYKKIYYLQNELYDEKVSWDQVQSYLTSIETDLYPPLTELRLNIIFTSESDNNEKEEEFTNRNVQNMLEVIGHSIENQLQVLDPVLSRVDIRLLDYPNAGLKEAIQEVNITSNDTTVSRYTMTKSRIMSLFNKKKNFNFDYFLRSGIEPACVDSCKQLFVVLYRPMKSHQPLFLSSKIPNGDMTNEIPISSDASISGFVIDQRLLLVAMNSVNHCWTSLSSFPTECSDLGSGSIQSLLSFILSKFLFPSLLYADRSHLQEEPRLELTDLNIESLLTSRIIHLQRSVNEVLRLIVNLDAESNYYLRLQKDSNLFATFQDAIKYQEMAKYCLENESLYAEGRAVKPFDRLKCAHDNLVSSSAYAQAVLDSPNMLNNIREEFEFLLAISVPYWLPILIPVMYGTLVEVKRYRTKIAITK